MDTKSPMNSLTTLAGPHPPRILQKACAGMRRYSTLYRSLGNREGSWGKEENVDEGARGATPAQIGAVAEEVPSRHLPPVTYEDLPNPLPLRKVLGPGVVSIGIGVSSGELIIWPFITSQIGLIFLWAAVIGVLTPFLFY